MEDGGTYGVIVIYVDGILDLLVGGKEVKTRRLKVALLFNDRQNGRHQIRPLQGM